MEGKPKMNILQAKQIMGKNFIGPEELENISSELGIINPKKIKGDVPPISFNEEELKEKKNDFIIILGIPNTNNGEKLTLNKLYSHLGYEPEKLEPCFYNQDWYLNEDFAKEKTLEFKWYLIKKTVNEGSRSKRPEEILKSLDSKEKFPSAILTAFVFFAYYFLNSEILWKHDFVWCSDKDKNNDRIFTGRYIDPEKLNKNGFNVHRHLSLRMCHASAPEIS